MVIKIARMPWGVLISYRLIKSRTVCNFPLNSIFFFKRESFSRQASVVYQKSFQLFGDWSRAAGGPREAQKLFRHRLITISTIEMNPLKTHSKQSKVAGEEVLACCLNAMLTGASQDAHNSS